MPFGVPGRAGNVPRRLHAQASFSQVVEGARAPPLGWHLQAALPENLRRALCVLEPRVLRGGTLLVPDPATHTRLGDRLVDVRHRRRVWPPCVPCLKGPGLQGKREELSQYRPLTPKIVLQLMQRKLCSHLLHRRDAVELLALPLREQAQAHPRNAADRRRDVERVEPEDSVDVVVAHDRADAGQCGHWHLREGQPAEVHEDDPTLGTTRGNHVAQHVLHAEDEEPHDAVRRRLLVPEPKLRHACWADDKSRPQEAVAASEVGDAVRQVRFQRRVHKGSGTKVGLAPVLRRQHVPQRLPGVSAVPAQVAGCRAGHGRVEGPPAGAGEVPEGLQPLLLFRPQLDVAVDLALLLSVSEVRNDRLFLGLESQDLLRQREGRDILRVDAQDIAIGDGGESAEGEAAAFLVGGRRGTWSSAKRLEGVSPLSGRRRRIRPAQESPGAQRRPRADMALVGTRVGRPPPRTDAPRSRRRQGSPQTSQTPGRGRRIPRRPRAAPLTGRGGVSRWQLRGSGT
mmetsp:Transcript_15764/g.47310  ORF Transcript_15764/g.47310 Transcript_15764/m.47310 type:complete len:512 (-) Transcript_15764:269-1804(-)